MLDVSSYTSNPISDHVASLHCRCLERSLQLHPRTTAHTLTWRSRGGWRPSRALWPTLGAPGRPLPGGAPAHPCASPHNTLHPPANTKSLYGAGLWSVLLAACEIFHASHTQSHTGWAQGCIEDNKGTLGIYKHGLVALAPERLSLDST